MQAGVSSRTNVPNCPSSIFSYKHILALFLTWTCPSSPKFSTVLKDDMADNWGSAVDYFWGSDGSADGLEPGVYLEDGKDIW